MRKLFFFPALLSLCLTFSACDQVLASEPATIKLSAIEAKQAQAIAEQRQQINFDRQQAQATFQSEMNRLAENETKLNIEVEQLCFTLKKNHSLNPAAKYYLDEWRGELRKK